MGVVLSDVATSDLNRRLEQWIGQRTGGRVHCLRVETDGGRIIVHGHTGSYGVRHLAMNAILEALDAAESEEFEEVQLRIEVFNAGVRSSTRCVCPIPRHTPCLK